MEEKHWITIGLVVLVLIISAELVAFGNQITTAKSDTSVTKTVQASESVKSCCCTVCTND